MEHARSRKSRRRPGVVLSALLLAASLVTAACGGADEPEAESGPVTISWGWWSNTPRRTRSTASGWTGSRPPTPTSRSSLSSCPGTRTGTR
ncbi:hypothetical protein ACFQZ4_41615 [Catellatospora coxensis]